MTMATEDDIIFWAFRYALGRHTYAVSDVARYIIANRKKLSQKTTDMIVREIRDHHERFGDGGWQCDKSEWDAVVDALSQPTNP